MPFFSVPPPNNSSRTSLSERKKSSYTTVSSSEPAMSVDENEKEHHSRSLRRGLSKRAKKVRHFFKKRMGRHHDEHDVDTLNENLSSLDVANMTSTSSFRTTTTISTSSGGHESLNEHDDSDDTPSHNTKDSKFSNDPTYNDKTTAAEQKENGQSNHVDRHSSTAEGEYGVSDTKQSGKPITTSIPELTPPISPTSATTSPYNSCYSIDKSVDDAVVDELSLRKNDDVSYKQPQIIISSSDSTPSASRELITNTDHKEQPTSPSATEVETKKVIADESKDSMAAPDIKETKRQVIDIQGKHQEEQVEPSKENTALEKTIQERVIQEEKKPSQKEEALTTQEEKIQSASTIPAQTQGQEPYAISSNDGSSNDKQDSFDAPKATEDTLTHSSVEQQQHPFEKESSVTKNDALAIKGEELTLTQGQLSNDQETSIAPEEKQPSLHSASVDEKQSPIKEKEEEPITNNQVPENSKKEEQRSLSVIQEPSFTDPATAVVKQDHEEHQPLLATQEVSSSTDVATIIDRQDDQAHNTTDKGEEISPFEINNEETTSDKESSSRNTNHEISCNENETQDNDAMSKRVAYFDKKRAGRISMFDTFTSLRGLGYHWLVAIPATFIVHLRLSPLTMPSHRSFSIKEYLLLPIYTERVAQALHTPILAAQRQRLGQWVQMYGHRHGNVYGLGFWGGFRTLRAAESNSTLRWWQLRSRLQWILTYTMLYDPSARMVTQPTLEGLCNR